MAEGKGQRKISKVIREFKAGELRSSSGQKVTSRKQAVAIALSEARAAGARIPNPKPDRGFFAHMMPDQLGRGSVKGSSTLDI